MTSDRDDLEPLREHLKNYTYFDADRIITFHDRLKEYEDTGLMPDEIERLRAENADKNSQIKGLETE